jgi:PII-like signaling protein
MRRLKLAVVTVLSAALIAGAIPMVNAVAQGTISFGGVKKNKKKGTAKLKVNLPVAGKVVCKGKKIKTAVKSRDAAGTVRVLIRAKGKAKTTLNRTGKVKVRFKCTFTPSNPGPYSPGSSSKKKRIKLIKNI